MIATLTRPTSMSKTLSLPLRLAAATLATATAAFADSLDVQIRPFLEPTTSFGFFNPAVSFRFAELTPDFTPNEATHILVQGLAPIEADPAVLAGGYEAVNLASGAIQDVGMVYLNLPAGAQLPEGTAASPIVGIIQRNGAWSATLPAAPASTTVGDTAGTGMYNVVSGSLTLNLSRGSTGFTGQTRYMTVDADTIELEAFSIATGSSSYAFGPARLVRDGDRFYGTITSTDATVGFDSLLFAVELNNLADHDSDGIPDLVDPKVPGLTLPMVQGIWLEHAVVGPYYPVNSEWAWSPKLGFFHAMSYPFIYQPQHGWMAVVTRISNNEIWLYSPATGYGWFGADELETLPRPN
jgi:hypothetical protein